MNPLYLIAFLFIEFSYCHVSPHSNVGIVGGHRISIEKVPYMVSLRLNRGTFHTCGGSIIHDQYVLTAAHCILPNREYSIVVGTDFIEEGGEHYNISKIIVHEKYSNKTFDFDICLIKLASPFHFGPKVAKINLPEADQKAKKGTVVTVTGWGVTKQNGSVSNDLLQVSIPIISSSSCQRTYIRFLRYISPRMMCAGGHGKDSCQGDSGGPLILDNVQMGVTSFGVSCGELPGVYTKIPALMPWIKQNIELN